MITETITVREDISDEDYDMNQLTHQLMHDTTQLLLDYIHHTQKRDLSHIEEVIEYAAVDYMKMDYYAKRNLELTESIRLKSKRDFVMLNEITTINPNEIVKASSI